MNKKLKVLTIVQQPGNSQIRFAECDKTGKTLPKGDSLTVSFSDPLKAAEYTHNADYDITIVKAKK